METMADEAREQIKQALGDEYDLTDERFNRVAPWIFIFMFLQESERALDLSAKFNEDKSLDVADQVLVAHSLFRASIMSYAKCYASAGKGRRTLDRKEVFKGEKDMLSVHDRMIDLRDKFAAHNDLNEIDAATMAVKEDDHQIALKHFYTIALPLNDYFTFKPVILHCQQYVVNGINKHLDRLQSELGKIITIG